MINYIFYIIYIFSQFLFANDDVVDWDKDTIKTNLHSFDVSLWSSGYEEIPWGMTFLPNGKMLVSDISGVLYLVSSDGKEKKKYKWRSKNF